MAPLLLIAALCIVAGAAPPLAVEPSATATGTAEATVSTADDVGIGAVPAIATPPRRSP